MAHEPRCGAIGFLIAPDGTVAAVTTDGRTVYIKGASTVSGSYEEEDEGETITYNFTIITLVGHDDKQYIFAMTINDDDIRCLDAEFNDYSMPPNSTGYNAAMALVSGLIPLTRLVPAVAAGLTGRFATFANFELAKWLKDNAEIAFRSLLGLVNVIIPGDSLNTYSFDGSIACVNNVLQLDNARFVNPDGYLFDCQYEVTDTRLTPPNEGIIGNLTGENLTEWQRLNAYNLIWYYGFSPSEFPYIQDA